MRYLITEVRPLGGQAVDLLLDEGRIAALGAPGTVGAAGAPLKVLSG